MSYGVKYSVMATLAIGFLLAAASAQAQLYKWVAPDGTVSYSDKPPPANAAKVERKSYGGSSPALDDLPFEVANAARGNPVTLYTGSNCAPCDFGRKLLTERGIPFSEKTVATNDDITQFNKVTGATQLPVLMVGRNKQMGFGADQWNSALTTAGYPTSNKLPKSYKNPSPEPLVASAAPATQADKPAAAPDSKPTPPAQQPANGSSPPGFHF